MFLATALFGIGMPQHKAKSTELGLEGSWGSGQGLVQPVPWSYLDDLGPHVPSVLLVQQDYAG